ncbi:hypothetical protein JRQ81_005567 [Phrynocephalus forsythii]|uniref:Uncharacterized protein n=1 Tax=Phrynocephalus forsythii TaxID=171643 RepID=A0A9Q1AVA9_9SAUR|nr:hypothetical protein JRQ81_005567 [Phrynocephalus forsythii]
MRKEFTDLRKMTYPMLVSFYFVILVSSSFSEHFELSSPLFIIGNVGENVLLPCQLSPPIQPQNMVVKWTKTVSGNTDIIYQYTAVTDQEVFGQGHKEKAVLSMEGLPSGNVSLKLKTLQMADEGNYTCMVTSSNWGSLAKTILYVVTPRGHSQSHCSPWSPAFWVTISLLLLLVLGNIIYHFRKRWKKCIPTKDSEEQGGKNSSLPQQKEYLPKKYSQAAELYAGIKALELADNRALTLYTDSKYLWSILHAHGQIWKERGLFTVSGSPVKHAALIERLLNAVTYPSQLAVIHCKGHQSDSSIISRANNVADFSARKAALGNPVEVPLLHVKKCNQQPFEAKWSEPVVVLLTSDTAVKVEGFKSLIHHTHVKKVKAPSTCKIHGAANQEGD